MASPLGILGVLVYYALQFPRARLGVLFYDRYYFHWARFSAYAGLTLWLVLQLFGSYLQIADYSSVSALAHLGGSLTGAVFWLLGGLVERWRRSMVGTFK
ncbi:MAG: rhomboid family intramembrane serine protease [Pirellulaceae bacterium]|nr:rhomboid family intramembrane serine protease [Pirellulaceae bacterium]